jgi:hypothetical protein
MSVYVVAILAPHVRLSVGDRVPDGVGAWALNFDTVAEALAWVAQPVRETFWRDHELAPLVVAEAPSGRVLSVIK